MTDAQDKAPNMFSFLISRPALGASIALLGALVGALLGACDGQNAAKDPDALYMKAGYTQAPRITEVARLADGMVRVTGRAVPDGRVRLASEEGRAIGINADDKGVFQIDLPAQTGGHLYELAMEYDGRLMLAEGRLFVPPERSGHVALLRSGAASLPVTRNAPLIAVVDLDRAGAIAVSGRAAAGTAVAISVDGQALTSATADSSGNYSAFLPLIHDRPVASVTVSAQAQTQSQSVTIRFDGNYPKLGPQTPVVISGLNPGWRVAWTLPGGGAQLSMVY